MEKASDISSAKRLVFPGVGSFQTAMDSIRDREYAQPLVDYIQVGVM